MRCYWGLMLSVVHVQGAAGKGAGGDVIWICYVLGRIFFYRDLHGSCRVVGAWD